MSTVKQTNRILIVEDDAAIRGLMTKHFRRNGFEVEQAAAAEEVFERFGAKSKRFDVVVTDVHLPGESGVDLARRIHATRPDQPIVFMTGDADAGIARQALQDGAAGYLLKPFQFHEMDAVVNRAVNRNDRGVVNRLQAVVHRQQTAHVTTPAKVMLAPARPRPSKFAARARVAMATAAMLGLAWAAGAAIVPGTVTTAPVQMSMQPAPTSQPVVVPIVIERSIYVNK